MDTSSEPPSPENQPKDYFGKEKRLLKLFGISLAGDEGSAYKIYSFAFIASFNFSYPILNILELFKHDFQVVADMMIYVFATVIALAKTLVVLRNRALIGKMFAKLEKEPFSANFERGGDTEEKLIKTCLLITSAQSITYWIFAAITVISTTSYVISKRLRSSDYHNWELPYGPLTVFNVSHSPNFEITLLYQNFAMITVVVNFTTVDLIMAAVLVHISFQFKILQNNVRRIVSNAYKEMCEDAASVKTNEIPHSDIDGFSIPWKYLQNNLKKTVDYHLAILNLAEELEAVFSKLLLLIFLGMLGMLCFLIYNASMIKDSSQMVRSIGEIMCGCLEVAIICYWGEQVVFESQEVGRAAFQANFAGTDLRFQRDLTLIIRRSQNPTSLTAGKFANVTLSTFVWVQRTAYSSFMVLRNNNNKM